MAKKGNRIQVILPCTDINDAGPAWNFRIHYNKKQKRNTLIDIRKLEEIFKSLLLKKHDCS